MDFVDLSRRKKELTVIALCILVFSIGLCMMLKEIPKKREGNNILYSYEINRKANYKVYLKENNYFEKEYLEEGKTYISELVDKIDIDFGYDYTMNKTADFKYTYKVVNELVIESDSISTKGGNLITKQYQLIAPTTIEKNDSGSYTVNQNISVDYQTYNEMVKKFSLAYNVPIKAYIDVKLIIDAESKITGIVEPVTEQAIVSIKLDLLQETFKVTKNFEATESKDKKEYENGLKADRNTIIIGTSLVFFALVGIAMTVNKIAKDRERRYYRINADKMLKKYEEIVARVVQPVDTGDRQIVDVKNFQQLVEIENEIRIPILFYETVKDKEGEFIIMYDNMVYRYIIRGKDINGK